MDNNKKKVLFLCTGNSCRSQMAEAWARELRSTEVTAFSAGIEDHGINPYISEVMAEKGINMASHFSKTIDSMHDQTFDVVIAVCEKAADNCPVLPGHPHIISVPFDDPPKLAQHQSSPEAILNCYRRVRDQIHDFIRVTPFE